MGTVPNGYFQSVLGLLSAPVSAENLRACHAWQKAEGGTAHNNPWNTTLDAPGATWYNTFGNHGQYHVRNYPSEHSGVHATVSTLMSTHYDHIVAALRAGHDGHKVCLMVDASPWGTHGAAREYVALYGAGPVHAPRRHLLVESPFMHGSDVRQVQEALLRRGYHVGNTGADGIYGPSTAAAVTALEKAHHLTPIDGVVGPQVYHVLGMA